jgi:hypothetical protein
MRINLLGPVTALALIAVVGGCGSSKTKSSTTSAAAAVTTVAATATTATAAATTTADDASTTTTPAEAEETGDAIALSNALGNDLTNDAACIQRTVGDATVALLDENDIGALPAKVTGDLFQAMAKCAHDTLVDNFATALPGLLGVTADQGSCVGEAFITIYKENRKAAEEGAKTFDEKDADVQAYIREKLGTCLPADKVDEFLTQQTG